MVIEDTMDIRAACITTTAVIPTQVIGIGNLELLARAPVANMHPHTAPTSHV